MRLGRRCLLLSGTTLLIGLDWDQARAAGTFTLMTVGGSWGDAIRKIIAEPFCQKRGLSVTFDNRPNAQQLAAVQAMRGQPTINSIEIGGPRLGQAISLGLLQKIDPQATPNFARVYPSLRNDFWAARSIAPWGLAFDPTVLPRAEVEARGWEMLLDPRVKGRVAVPGYGWMGEMWMHSVNLAHGAPYSDLDYSIRLAARTLRDNDGVVMGSNDQGMKLFTTGEIACAPFWSGRTFELKRKGVSLDFVYPPGWSPYGFGFSVLSGDRDPALTAAFVDFSLSEAVQLQFARQFSYVPTLQGMTLPEDLAESRVSSETFARAANLDYIEVVKYSDANLERWNKEVIG